MTDPDSDMTFDEITTRIDTLARQLEAPDLPLEQAILCYQEGSELLKKAQSRLSDAEQQVRMLNLEADPTDEREDP
ncbi:unnamed protein product [Discosporangium mesarthrocarpum]